jgi:hypothetical protein
MYGQRNMSAERSGSGYSPTQLSKEQINLLLQSQEDQFLASVFVDLSSRRPKTEETYAEFRQLLQTQFTLKLPSVLERIWELPPVILKRSNDEYVGLLEEARELFKMGYFYACVAMCGIVGERLVKDLLRSSLFVAYETQLKPPPEDAFDQLERVDVSALVRFFNKAQLLGDDARKAAEDLIVLRNRYAHARGEGSQTDALEAIAKLHLLLEGTVSMLKDHEIVEGRFVPRAAKL